MRPAHPVMPLSLGKLSFPQKEAAHLKGPPQNPKILWGPFERAKLMAH